MNSLHQVPTERVNNYTVITLPRYIAPKKFAVLHLARALFKLMDRCEFKVTKYNIVCVIQEHCQLIQNTPQKRKRGNSDNNRTTSKQERIGNRI